MSTAGHMPTIHPSKNEPVISKFTINNLQHLMVKGVKEKIERLYKVSIRFTEKDEGGYWVEIQGDVIDRRNAKIYCNSICNPMSCSLVKLPEPLFVKCIEQIEHHTNASIKQVGKFGQYKISGNSSSMALALSILSDVKESGVLGTPAGSVWSASGKTSKGEKATTKDVIEKHVAPDGNCTASNKAEAQNSNTLVDGNINSLSNSVKAARDEKDKTEDHTNNSAEAIVEKAQNSTEETVEEKDQKAMKSKTLSKNLFASENIINSGGAAVLDNNEPLKDSSKRTDIESCTLQQSDNESNKTQSESHGMVKGKNESSNKPDTEIGHSKGEKSLRMTEMPSLAEEDNKETSENHQVKENVLDFSLPFENTSFSSDVLHSKKKSRASKRLSISLLSVLNASNARMDNCLEAPDTVKRAILSCLESEENIEITDDSVTLVDNDEDENKIVDVSQIVISDDDDEDDNDITVITLDDTFIEVNNNESESEICADEFEHNCLRTNGATRDVEAERINPLEDGITNEIHEDVNDMSFIILDETVAEVNIKDSENVKCADKVVDNCLSTSAASKDKETENTMPLEKVTSEIHEEDNDISYITLDETIVEMNDNKSENEKCAEKDEDNCLSTNTTIIDIGAESILPPAEVTSEINSEISDDFTSCKSVEENTNEETDSTALSSGDSQKCGKKSEKVDKLGVNLIAKFTALRNKQLKISDKIANQKENVDYNTQNNTAMVHVHLSDISESIDELSDSTISNKSTKLTAEAKNITSDAASLPDEKTLEEGEIISSGSGDDNVESQKVGNTGVLVERKKRKSGNKADSTDDISKTKKIKLSKISHKYLPERYRTPYYNKAESKAKENKKQYKSEETNDVGNKENKKKKKKKKRKRKVEIIEIPSQSSEDSETFSKKVRKADVSRTPEVSHTSERDLTRTPPMTKDWDAGRRRHVPRTPMTPYLIGQSSLATRKKRYIVIDGSNVAMAHGNSKVFSCRGILLAVDYFRKRGHDLITVFLPQWRKCRPENPALMTDQYLLDKLEREGYLVFTPSRRIGRKLVAAYDDRFILELAEREDGVVVSNDNFRDLKCEKWSWRRVIEDRLLMYSFARDHFMVPEDPLGRHGPTLDKFLDH